MCCKQITDAQPLDLAAGCYACPDGGGNAVYCRATTAQLTISAVVNGAAACPLQRLPKIDDPTFRWLRARWRGVPWPVRVWIHALGGPHPEEFEGCGCLDRARAFIERVAAAAGYPAGVIATSSAPMP